MGDWVALSLRRESHKARGEVCPEAPSKIMSLTHTRPQQQFHQRVRTRKAPFKAGRGRLRAATRSAAEGRSAFSFC